LASFDFDQAEGLRRMLAGPKPRVFTFLSAASGEEKGAMLVNLGASLAQAGRDVLLLDACAGAEGIATRLEAVRGATLLQVARQERALDDVIQQMPQGFGVAALRRGAQKLAPKDEEQGRRLDDAFEVLATRADIVVVDAELDKDDTFAIPALASSEIVIQVSSSPDSIKSAYAIIKRVNGQLGRRPFSILVTGASEKEAQLVYDNMAQAANRYLAVKLNSMGSVPADEHLKRAMRLGRAVVDAFPLAGASVAFRRLAGRFVLSDVATAG
jgi:flagellar biosynthesis protein FlhG